MGVQVNECVFWPNSALVEEMPIGFSKFYLVLSLIPPCLWASLVSKNVGDVHEVSRSFDTISY